MDMGNPAAVVSKLAGVWGMGLRKLAWAWLIGVSLRQSACSQANWLAGLRKVACASHTCPTVLSVCRCGVGLIGLSLVLAAERIRGIVQTLCPRCLKTLTNVLPDLMAFYERILNRETNSIFAWVTRDADQISISIREIPRLWTRVREQVRVRLDAHRKPGLFLETFGLIPTPELEAVLFKPLSQLMKPHPELENLAEDECNRRVMGVGSALFQLLAIQHELGEPLNLNGDLISDLWDESIVPNRMDGTAALNAMFTSITLKAKIPVDEQMLKFNRDHTIYDKDFRPPTFRRILPSNDPPRAPIPVVLPVELKWAGSPLTEDEQPPKRQRQQTTHGEMEAHGVKKRQAKKKTTGGKRRAKTPPVNAGRKLRSGNQVMFIVLILWSPSVHLGVKFTSLLFTICQEHARRGLNSTHGSKHRQACLLARPVARGEGTKVLGVPREIVDDGEASNSGEAWCKRAQAKPSHPRPRPRPPSQIQTPLSGTSQFGKPIGEVCPPANAAPALHLLRCHWPHTQFRRVHLTLSLGTRNNTNESQDRDIGCVRFGSQDLADSPPPMRLSISQPSRTTPSGVIPPGAGKITAQFLPKMHVSDPYPQEITGYRFNLASGHGSGRRPLFVAPVKWFAEQVLAPQRELAQRFLLGLSPGLNVCLSILLVAWCIYAGDGLARNIRQHLIGNVLAWDGGLSLQLALKN
ncbi:hypothetical protein DFH06DRAFT_1132652 [Mycena polygramma]|nr:hypothetical protein DFH06DRAFT_1132652 [Mycena polygramma]